MTDVEDSAVNDFLLILEEHRKNCERQGKYVEAEIAKNRLEELKVHEENRRREAMRSRQIAERLGVEEAHMLEFQQFNQVWDRKMDEYERNVEELEFQQKMLERHQKPKFSKDLLNLRRIEEHLARQKEYVGVTDLSATATALTFPVYCVGCAATARRTRSSSSRTRWRPGNSRSGATSSSRRCSSAR